MQLRLKMHYSRQYMELVHLEFRKHNDGELTLTRHTRMDLLPELACLQLCPYIDYDKIMLAEVTGASVLVGRVATLALFFSK